MVSWTHCTRCGRLLKNPQSISRKYGPSCYARVHGIIRFTGKIEVPRIPTRFESIPHKQKTLWELFGPKLSKGVVKQMKIEESEPSLKDVAKEAEHIHRKALK